MDTATRRKWDRASRIYDWMNWGDVRRFGGAKQRLFAKMRGRCLMVAAGTGCDFQWFPPGLTITAIDISEGMVARAGARAAMYDGSLEVRTMDVRQMEYPDAVFDTVVTACTFCSVPDPVRGLREVYRCLKPGGQLLMFEHVRSAIGPIGLMQDVMTAVTRKFGPDMNRDTAGNVVRAGFALIDVSKVYLDVVVAIEARRPLAAPGV